MLLLFSAKHEWNFLYLLLIILLTLKESTKPFYHDRWNWRSCHGNCLCKAKIAKNKNKFRQIKIEGNFSLYLKVVKKKKKIIKETNLDFSSPINRDSQILLRHTNLWLYRKIGSRVCSTLTSESHAISIFPWGKFSLVHEPHLQTSSGKLLYLLCLQSISICKILFLPWPHFHC